MDFIKGSIYDTPYGTAKAMGPTSRGSRLFEFKIIEPSSEAAKMGYRRGSVFKAHPEDQVFPPPSEWNRLGDIGEDDYDEPSEPEEGDITTTDDKHWYQYGKLYFTGDRAGLTKKMDKDQFWPNVWSISDHGNAELITDFSGAGFAGGYEPQKITPSILKAIKVLWRQSDTMALWGIPYNMREGQQPSDLWKSTSVPDTTAQARGWYGRTISAPGPREGWVWLGQPGWWGHLTKAEQREVEEFLASISGDIPEYPNEWVTLERR